MRRTLRQLAAVKPARYLEAGTPTGLTGLLTHPAPRSQLLYLYSSTLDKLKQFPESSLYRQSTEALTNHRMAIVSAVEPEGWKEWSERARKVVAANPEVFNTPEGQVPHDNEKWVREVVDGKSFVTLKAEEDYDDTKVEWDGEEYNGGEGEGIRNEAERKYQSVIGKKRPGSETKTVAWDPEPPLTVEQISELENKLGAGLIEEVIQVAEGELKLAGIMLQAKVWEDLEEKPVEGQWTYFDRTSGKPSSPTPPQK